MTRPFVAAMRRATKLMRPARVRKGTKTIQKTMIGLMAKAMVSALPAQAPQKTAPKSVSRKSKGVKSAGSLGAVVGMLQSARPPKPVRSGAAIARAAKVASGLQPVQRHRSAGASRNYQVHMPDTHTAKPKGLLLMLHGCGQTVDDFALGTGMNRHADKHGLIVVYVAQTAVDNA